MKPLLLALLASLPTSAMPGPQDLAVRLVQPLDFGTLLVEGGGGAFALTAGGRPITFSPWVSVSGGGAGREARFLVTGPPGARVRFSVDPTRPILIGPRGGGIRVEEFLLPDQGNEVSLDASGRAEIRIGAKLDLPVGIEPGRFACNELRLKAQLVSSLAAASSTVTQAEQVFGAYAYLRAPLKLQARSGLDFGGLLPGPQGGAIEVRPLGGFVMHGPSAPVLVKGSPMAASFFVEGPTGCAFTIHLPREVHLLGPGAPMTVRSFTCSLPSSQVLGPGGTEFKVGGTLHLNPQQAPGEYKGQVQVTVTYL